MAGVKACQFRDRGGQRIGFQGKKPQALRPETLKLMQPEVVVSQNEGTPV